MPPGKVDLYNLGSVGIDLTKSKIHADDGSLLRSQNAVPDPRGEVGALTKRDGLVAINSSTAGGSITGALDIPLPAPAITDAATKRWLYFGRESAAGGNELDWGISLAYPTGLSSLSFANSVAPVSYLANIIIANRPTPGNGACVWNNTLFYARGDFTQDTDSPPIHTFQTTNHLTASTSKDRELTRLPINPDVGLVSKAVVAMFVEGSYIYVSSLDAGTTSTNQKASVYRLDPKTGAFFKLGTTFPTGYVPSCFTWYQGKLWCGTWQIGGAADGGVYWIRPGIDTTWTLDHTIDASIRNVYSIAAYNGELFVATNGSSLTAAVILKRTSTGTWSTSLTGSVAQTFNWWRSLVVFKENLYANYGETFGVAGGLISKYDGSSWTTVTTGTEFMVLTTDQTTIFSMYVGDNSTSSTGWIYSTDGTTWTPVVSSISTFEILPSFGFLLE